MLALAIPSHKTLGIALPSLVRRADDPLASLVAAIAAISFPTFEGAEKDELPSSELESSPPTSRGKEASNEVRAWRPGMELNFSVGSAKRGGFDMATS